MWTYEQLTGALWDTNGQIIWRGYSGAPSGENNPSMENVTDVGPIPRGYYSIGAPADTVSHGPYVLPLTPAAMNEMYGRSGFLIHGDSIEHPGEASQGCIIMPRAVREQIWTSCDHQLKVVSQVPAMTQT